MDADFEFDFEKTLEAQQPSTAGDASGAVNIGPGGRAEAKPRNYRQVIKKKLPLHVIYNSLLNKIAYSTHTNSLHLLFLSLNRQYAPIGSEVSV